MFELSADRANQKLFLSHIVPTKMFESFSDFKHFLQYYSVRYYSSRNVSIDFIIYK